MPANEAVPETQAGRIKWVAERVYPAGRWRARIAKGPGIGRSTLYRFLSGRKRSRRGLDDKLIVLMARERIATEILEYVPTQKGRRVGAWALPTTTLWDLTREWTPEHAAKLAASRAKRTTKQVLKVLTFNSGRIRGSQVMFVSGGRLVAGFASAYREPLSEAVMNLVRPHCEEFTDVDGKQSLRITEAGIAATARPRRAR